MLGHIISLSTFERAKIMPSMFSYDKGMKLEINSRDIILLTKVHIVRATVFPVVMYGYESWIIKKAESEK